MRVAIVDDDANWRKRIQRKIVQYDTMKEIEITLFSSGEQYLANKEHYDISLIDIEMQGLDGFDTISEARKYNPEGIYVILTTHIEMSRKGYVVNAFRYIDKTELDELQEALASAQIILGRNKRIKVSVVDAGIRELTLKNIIYVETEKHYILFHTKQGVVKCSDNMKDVEKILPTEWFCRCHNAFIVNLDEIARIEDRIVYLSNGEDIDVSQRKLNQFKKLYVDRQFECANR